MVAEGFQFGVEAVFGAISAIAIIAGFVIIIVGVLYALYIGFILVVFVLCEIYNYINL
jgi:hypothetical protein